MSELSREGFSLNNWWLGTRDVGLRTRGERFALRMAEDKKGFVNEMVETVWRLFTEHAELLEAANRSLVGWRPES